MVIGQCALITCCKGDKSLLLSYPAQHLSDRISDLKMVVWYLFICDLGFQSLLALLKTETFCTAQTGLGKKTHLLNPITYVVEEQIE